MIRKKLKPIIEVTQLSKIYRVEDIETVALDKITFTVNKGEYVAIMGPSGSGKSTLMHILGALDVPTSGGYKLDGVLVQQMTSDELAEIRNKKIGFVFQAYNLLPRVSALQNVILPMRYGGVASIEREARAREYLTLVGLENRMQHLSNQLSGGQQQRVAIARALVMNPSIILADEPTGNIASNQAEEIMAIFEKLHQVGHTIIMITHESDIAEHAERIVTIKDGHLVADKKS